MKRLFSAVVAAALAAAAGAAEFTLAPAGTNDMTEAVMSAFDGCRLAGGGKVVFAPGEYHFRSPLKQTMYVSNHDNPMPRNVFLAVVGLSGVDIASKGARFVFHGEGIALALVDCRDVSVTGVAFDYARPYFTEMRLVGGRLDYAGCGYPCKVENGKLFAVGPGWKEPQHLAAFFDRDTRRILGVKWWNGDVEHAFTGYPDGTIVVTRNGYRPNPCVFLYRSHDVTFAGCGAYSSAGMGLIAQRSSDVTVTGWKTRGGRQTALQADATHFSNCRGTIRVENSLFEGMLDDAINVHSTCLKIIGKPAADRIVCRYMHVQSVGFEVFLPGETLRFIKGSTLEPGCEAVVEEVRTLAYDRVELRLGNPVPAGYGVGDAVENADWQPAVVFRGNTVRNSSPRATLFTTPKPVVCESNRFEHVAGQPILFGGDAWDWYESGACRDVVIRGNSFIGCAYLSGKGMIQINPAVHDLASQKKRYHRNIIVEDNLFQDFTKPLVWGLSAENLVFRGNRIINGNTRMELKGVEKVVTDF
jgi:hypothetical protein